MDEIASHQLANLIKPSAKGNSNTGPRNRNRTVYFTRNELSQILNVYGRLVTAGEWRDYAIDHVQDHAVFSIFRRASEIPHYRIIKEPALSNQQGAWRILGAAGQVLKRGRKLDQLLRYFDRHHLKAIT